MKKIIYILIPLVFLCCLIASTPRLQTKMQKPDNTSQRLLEMKQDMKSSGNLADDFKSLKCKTCHVGEYPTAKDPLLRECPRESMLTAERSSKEGPDVVLINEMSDKYEGVVFSHKIHAQMSEISSGCSGCHHYNTSGPVLNCSKCHSKNRSREDVSVPDLKSAFHRMCTDCHKQWSGENGCNTQCHKQKGTDIQNDSEKKMELIKGKSHPLLPEPTKMVWETNYEKGKLVTFFHDEHFKVFKITCNTCHRQDNCIKCHNKKEPVDYNSPVKVSKSFEDHHRPCSSCHAGNSCQKCHSDKELTQFNHAKSTGFALSSYHSSLECSRCHGKSMPYKSLDRNCNSCHKNFKMGSFNHKVTGLMLSESHTEIECKTCHKNEDFSKDPVCAECHDDKSHPQHSPGKRTR